MEIRQAAISSLAVYGEISIAFTVYSVFDVVPVRNGLEGLGLAERKLDAPYDKDYDLERNNKPNHWLKRFDTRYWVVFFAYDKNDRVGGVTIAWKTPELTLIPYRKETALIWDLRVKPEMRFLGLGRKLVAAAKEWAMSKGCDEIIVETQNINVPACRFYASQGFELFSINPLAYPELPSETQLLWRLKIN